jgi:hypothetical protein
MAVTRKQIDSVTITFNIGTTPEKTRCGSRRRLTLDETGRTRRVSDRAAERL